MSWDDLTQWMADRPLVRQVADSWLRSRARRDLAVLDKLSPGRIQALTLSRLVRKALKTRFSRDHDFRRIRNVADFRRLVPLCTPLDLWHAYWSASFPALAGVTWPTGVAVLPSRAYGAKPTLVTAETWATHQKAIATALGFAIDARPRVRLLQGNIIWLEDSTVSPGADEQAIPRLLRPYSRVQKETARNLDEDHAALDRAAEEWGSVTGLVGEGSRLVRVLTALRRSLKSADLRQLWPQLSVVLFSEKSASSHRAKLQDLLTTDQGEAPLLMEMAGRVDCPLAVEDPRHGLLRLLPHLGVYWEFVPISELQDPRPTRHGLDEVETGVDYAVAVTSPAGLWACLTGQSICFERRDPHLIRMVSSATRRGYQESVDISVPHQPPHKRNSVAPSPASVTALRKSR